MPAITPQQSALRQLADALIDQQAARIVVRPQQTGEGFWFGGGNLMQADNDDAYLVGRYRNRGDSRTGLAAGQRGLELAIFRAEQLGRFEPVMRWSKADFRVDGAEVLSIEGSALRKRFDGGVELFVSVEFERPYPEVVKEYQKPGAGVWSILSLEADDLPRLRTATPRVVLHSDEPTHLHVKDPFIYQPAKARDDDDVVLGFCSHPYNWSSSNTGFVRRSRGQWAEPLWEVVPRGPAWDVAMTRATAVVDIPPLGSFQDGQWSLMFYDGGECVRRLEPHAAGIARPRGHSCEELGGAALVESNRWQQAVRLSPWAPQFISPWGTGCSRYVSICPTDDAWIATWQQSQTDGSQPLVLHSLPRERVESLLQADSRAM